MGTLGKHWKQKPETIERKRQAILGHPGYFKGGKLSEEAKEKIRQSKLGSRNHRFGKPPWNKGLKAVIPRERHWNWKGGITPINHLIRNSTEYREWRKCVFERDNYTCLFCGVRSGNGRKVYLHADHIKPFAYFPELRFEISNGRTLCRECHRKTETYGTRIIRK